jgi:hypothetical protein
MDLGYCGFILYYSHVYKGVSHLYKIALINHVYHTRFHYSTGYEHQRGKLRREVGRGKMRMEVLLGDPKVIKHTLEYIEETGRLNVN